MANKSADFGAVGNYARGSMLETVELSAAIASGDVGKALKATGVNADGQLKCAVQDTTTTPIAVAILESVGAVGDLVQVLIRGDVVIKEADGAIPAGAALTVKDGKFGALTLSSAYTHTVGFSRAVFATGDSGLICFSGP